MRTLMIFSDCLKTRIKYMFQTVRNITNDNTLDRLDDIVPGPAREVMEVSAACTFHKNQMYNILTKSNGAEAAAGKKQVEAFDTSETV